MRILIFSLMGVLFCSFARAETITLKSGEKLEGEILDQNEDYLKIGSGGKIWVYALKEVASIAAKPAAPKPRFVFSPQPLLKNEPADTTATSSSKEKTGANSADPMLAQLESLQAQYKGELDARRLDQTKVLEEASKVLSKNNRKILKDFAEGKKYDLGQEK